MMHLPSEIVLEILKYAGRDIAPFLRINTQWFRCGISLVWSRVLSPAILRVPKHRRQIYASEIRHFISWCRTSEQFKELGQLSWPKLESLFVDFPERDGLALADYMTSLECYLGDRLRHLELAGPFHPELLSFFRASCPQLREFSIKRSGPGLTPENLLTFLEESPSLTNLSIWSGELPLVTGQTLNHLAGRKNLQYLSLSEEKDIDAINAVNEPSPFPHLQNLDVSATEATLSPLVSMVRCVRNLRISLARLDDDDTFLSFDSVALRHVSTLVELQDLNLFIMGAMRIRNEDLLSLKNLTQLKRLSIEGHPLPSFTAPNFDDANFEELFTNLRQLEVLKLNISLFELTTDSLKSLGTCCPSLRQCDITEVCDLAAFRYENTPLFSNLEFLRIDSFTNLERLCSWSRPYDHVRQLEKHFPKLQELECTFAEALDEDELSEKIMQLWWKRQINGKAKAARQPKRPRV
ncbi:uncharacterized protein LDX57_012497 [Aspergillus melleus]|uniref:uncharacterized protein n=1 Tax=Aspergillus melleus TaxID=138277 RepID=UPI001E8DDE17|nr:uncharacterized protein LDX57_012497 [Aspergillus melleus]KAH8434866.1 hypothetical protein LDX57_012497 [Aspergillus melleus]